MNIPHHEVIPATRLRFPSSVSRIHPVLTKNIPDRPLPFWRINFRSRNTVVGSKIMIIPDRIHRRRGNEPLPFGTGLSSIIAIVLSQGVFRLIDIDIVSQHQHGLWSLGQNDIPHPFPLRDISGPSSEGDLALDGITQPGRSRKRSDLVSLTNSVIVTSLRF